jgi:hypothetical protein
LFTVTETTAVAGVSASGAAQALTTALTRFATVDGVEAEGSAETLYVPSGIAAFGCAASADAGLISDEVAALIGDVFCAGVVGEIEANISGISHSTPAPYNNIDNPDILQADPLPNKFIAASFSTVEALALTRLQLLLSKEPV